MRQTDYVVTYNRQLTPARTYMLMYRGERWEVSIVLDEPEAAIRRQVAKAFRDARSRQRRQPAP